MDTKDKLLMQFLSTLESASDSKGEAVENLLALVVAQAALERAADGISIAVKEKNSEDMMAAMQAYVDAQKQLDAAEEEVEKKIGADLFAQVKETLKDSNKEADDNLDS